MSASQSCKKLMRKRVKTCDKSKKLRNAALATYFANFVVNFSNVLLLICINIPSTGAKSKTQKQKTVTFKMEVFGAIVNGFHLLSVRGGNH